MLNINLTTKTFTVQIFIKHYNGIKVTINKIILIKMITKYENKTLGLN